MMLYFCLGVYCATIWIYIAFLADFAMYQLSSEAIPFLAPYSNVQFSKLRAVCVQSSPGPVTKDTGGAFGMGMGTCANGRKMVEGTFFQLLMVISLALAGGKMECEGDVANLNFLLVIFCAIVLR